jgi:hypothetical protein
MEESTRRLRTLDFFMGIGFAAIGLYVAIDGYKIFISPNLATEIGRASCRERV